MILQMRSDISSASREIYLNSLETLRRLDKHDHVASFYGTYDAPSGACSVIEFSQFGEGGCVNVCQISCSLS